MTDCYTGDTTKKINSNLLYYVLVFGIHLTPVAAIRIQ